MKLDTIMLITTTRTMLFLLWVKVISLLLILASNAISVPNALKYRKFIVIALCCLFFGLSLTYIAIYNDDYKYQIGFINA